MVKSYNDNNGDYNSEAEDNRGTDSWYAVKWTQFLKGYKRLSPTYSYKTEKITMRPEPTISASDLDSEIEIDIEETRERKRGYNPNLGYYQNYIIVDMFSQQSKTFVLDYRDIQSALTYGIGMENIDEFPEKVITTDDLISLDNQLRNKPEWTVRSLRMAVYKIMKEAHHEYAMEIKDDFKARFKNMPDKLELSDITNKHVERMFTFEGFVTAVDETTRLLYRKTSWECRDSHVTEVIGHNKPRKCDECNATTLRFVPEAALTETYQEFRLQQKHDQTKDGRIAVERDVVLIGDDVVNVVQGGDYVQLSGIVKVRENTNSSNYKKKNSDVVDFYIEASYVERKPDDSMMILVEKDSMYLEDEVKDAVKPDTEDLDYQKLCRSIAPTVIGHEIVKECMLLQMASSDSRTFEDGTPHRGHLVLMFCGSPSSAKTVLARYIHKVHIRSVMPSGDGLTKAGLTAAVDTKVNPPRLAAGAYLMAKNGIVIIDELQSLKLDTLNALLEACEDAQTITITKAGIHRPLKADCASLHLCNPKETSYWDDSKNIMENTGFLANHLSRYDAVIVFRDIPNPEEDEKKAAHWLKHYANATKDFQKPKDVDIPTRRKSMPTRGGLHSLPYMAMWLRYVRKTFHPTLAPDSEAFKVIQNYYLHARRTDARFFSQGVMDDDIKDSETKQKIPSITMRQLASLIRFAEASARAHHRNIVEVKDAEIACEIMRFSILNSGFNPITKQVADDPNAMMSKSNAPKVREIDIMRLANRKENIFYKQMAKQAKQFESVVKKAAIGRCLYCEGKGFIMNNIGGTADCTECKGLGSKRLRFLMSDVEDSLHHAGFTRADIETMADMFVRCNILTQDGEGFYRTVHEYSLVRGYKEIHLLDTDIEVAVDIDGNLQKIHEVAQYLPESEKEKIQRKVQELK